ncbi:hypothetical protein [Fructobacillus cardui]|uniref:hypothetical protein n=1 Tax=Fructobacillus cardui TaxID=2893170 RepID=UPI00200A3BF9|nr:hypothetical protein [Fructobacillus cardui]MCK8627655.1 hypothetical protein [Fructobacillus cardui]
MTDTQELEQEFLNIKQNKPKWLTSNGNGAPAINYLRLADEILKNNPLTVAPFGDDMNYYMFNGVNWEQVKKERATAQAKRVAMHYLETENVYTVRKMEDTAKTVLVQAQKSYNPFEKQKTDRVAFKNGTYMLKSGEMVANNPEDYLINGHKVVTENLPALVRLP